MMPKTDVFLGLNAIITKQKQTKKTQAGFLNSCYNLFDSFCAALVAEKTLSAINTEQLLTYQHFSASIN